MSKRPYMKTTKKQIIEWGMEHINNSDYFGYEGGNFKPLWSEEHEKYLPLGEVGYGVDACDMDTRCWRCGHEKNTQRCHVIPHSLGGEDKPYNYRLFCELCHFEQPNVFDYNATDKWVRDTCVGSYDVFWTYREIWYKLDKQVSVHWGENLNKSTIEWKLNKFIEYSGLALYGFCQDTFDKAMRCVKSQQYIPAYFEKGEIPNYGKKLKEEVEKSILERKVA